MEYGKLLSYLSTGSQVVLQYEKQNVTLDFITDEIVNVFVPIRSIEHYSNRTMVPIRTGKLEVYGRPWKREYKILWEDEKRKDEGKWKQEA